MAEPILQLEGITKSFGAVMASDGVSLNLKPGEIHALIGPNGAGKSTLIAQIAGSLRVDAGWMRFLDQDVTNLPAVARAQLGLMRSFQVSSVIADFSVEQNLTLAIQSRQRRNFQLWGRAKAQVTSVAERLGLQDRLSMVAGDLTHGERRRLEIAMALAMQPKAFLLDEPMAGLAVDDVGSMTKLLAELKTEAPILLVEHDMDAVFTLADRISVLVYGKIIASGIVDAIRSNPVVQAAYLGDHS